MRRSSLQISRHGYIAQLGPRLSIAKRARKQIRKYVCEFALVLSDGSESDIAKIAQLQPLRGFDRLSAAGFSESDIANFRRQFHSQSASNYLDTDFDTEEECVFILPAPTVCTIDAACL